MCDARRWNPFVVRPVRVCHWMKRYNKYLSKRCVNGRPPWRRWCDTRHQRNKDRMQTLYIIIKCTSAYLAAHTHTHWNTVDRGGWCWTIWRKGGNWLFKFVGGAFEFRSIIIVSNYRHDKINYRHIHTHTKYQKKKKTKTRRQDMQTKQTQQKIKRHTQIYDREIQHFLCRPHTIFSLRPTHARPMMKQSEAKQPTRNKQPPASQWNLCYVYCVCVGLASLYQRTDKNPESHENVYNILDRSKTKRKRSSDWGEREKN